MTNTPTCDSPALTLGPILFNWPLDVWEDFYARVADEADVDRVMLGEVVCGKRLPFYENFIPRTAERLQRGGKSVVLSSLALVTTPREHHLTAALLANGDFDVEVNDLTLMNSLAGGRCFTVGPFVNVYNEPTLAFLARRGANHVCVPPELPFSSIEILARAGAVLGTKIEVWAFGRAPLAISARCYHARLQGLSKDSCRFVCVEDRDGLAVRTLDGEDFLAVNGVQTLSHSCVSTLGHMNRLAAAGVSSFRLSPHDCDMVGVARLYRNHLTGAIDGEEAMRQLGEIASFAPFSNGFLFGVPGAERVATGAD